jgi:hydroxypyruvate isomerase
LNPASPLAEEREATVYCYKEVVDLALDLGAEKVLYIAGWQIFGTNRQQAWDWSSSCLERIASYAGEKGITVVVEPTPAATNLIETADDALELMRSVRRLSNVKVSSTLFTHFIATKYPQITFERWEKISSTYMYRIRIECFQVKVEWIGWGSCEH